MHIREVWDSTDLVVELTTENNRINVVGVLGVFDINIPATETADIEIDAGVYDLEVLPAGFEDEAIKLAYGKVKINPEATR
jgi:hypothetical protein